MGSIGSHVVVGVLLASLGGGAATVAAQSMAEAARKERERRAKQAGASSAPAKVYTDADLPASEAPPAGKPAPSPSPSPSATPAATEAEREAQERTDAADRKRLEAEWRVRFADARRRISEAEARCWHKVVRTVFVAGIPVQQWVDEFEESEELRQTRRDLADLEEEYRKTGLPPGWVRD